MNPSPPAGGARTWLLAAAAALALALAYAARDALVPFILALLAAYICAPAVDRLAQRGLPRWAAALLLVLAALVA